MKLVKSSSLTLFVFGVLGWMYVAASAMFHPHTLSWQLTHFAPWPREDTFGIVCFGVAIASFFIWNLARYSTEK